MSLESQIATLTEAIDNLAFILKQQAVLNHAAPVVTITPEPEPKPLPVVTAAPAPVVAPVPVAAPVMPTPVFTPVPAPVVAPAVVAMPAPPVFLSQPVAAPVAPAQSAAPFSDAKGLMDYIMASYTAMGAEKGSKIQDVLKSLGVAAVNEIKPEQYAALFAGVEALK